MIATILTLGALPNAPSPFFYFKIKKKKPKTETICCELATHIFTLFLTLNELWLLANKDYNAVIR